eukprot:3542970-Rhodomonas_salina.2
MGPPRSALPGGHCCGVLVHACPRFLSSPSFSGLLSRTSGADLGTDPHTSCDPGTVKVDALRTHRNQFDTECQQRSPVQPGMIKSSILVSWEKLLSVRAMLLWSQSRGARARVTPTVLAERRVH